MGRKRVREVLTILICICALQLIRVEASHFYFAPVSWPSLEHEDARPLMPVAGSIYQDTGSYVVGHISERVLFTTVAPKEKPTENILNLIKSKEGAFLCLWVALQPILKMRDDKRLYVLFEGVYEENKQNNVFQLAINVEGIPILSLKAPSKTLQVTATNGKLTLDSTYTYLCVKLWLSHADSLHEANIQEIYANGVKLRATKKTQKMKSINKTRLPSIGRNDSSSLPWKFSFLTFIEGPEASLCCKPPGCESDSCLNGGTCIPSYAPIPGYICSCAKGFAGDVCNEKQLACRKQPCKNGGTCEELGHQKFKCHCPPGIIGELCELTKPDPSKMKHLLMSELLLFPRYTHINSGRKAEFLILTLGMGRNFSFSWTLAFHNNNTEVASIPNFSPLIFTRDPNIIIDYPEVPDSIRKSKTGFFYRFFSTIIEKEGVYTMTFKGYTNREERHKVSATVNVDPPSKDIQVYVSSEIFDADSTGSLLFVLPGEASTRYHLTVTCKELRINISETVTFLRGDLSYTYLIARLRKRFGENIIFPPKSYLYLTTDLQFSNTGSFPVHATLMDMSNKKKAPIEASVNVAVINRIKYFELLPKQSNKFENEPAHFVAIMSERLGTKPSFTWSVGASNTFVAPLPTLKNCKSCIESVVSPDEFNTLELPENYFVWTYNYTFTLAGEYLIHVEAKNDEMLIIERVVKISVLEPMSEIFLFTKETLVHVGEPVAFVLYVKVLGSEPSFTFDFGDGQTEKIVSLHPYKPEKNADLLKYLAPADLGMFVLESYYYVKQYTFDSDGEYTARAFGFNKGKLQRESTVKVEAFYAIKGLRLLVSDTLVPVTTSVSVVVLAVDKGHQPFLSLKHHEQEEMNITSLNFTQSAKPIENIVGLSKDDWKELTAKGFFYTVIERTAEKVGTMTFELDAFNKNRKVATKKAVVKVTERICDPNITLVNVGSELRSAVAYHRKDSINVEIETTLACSNRDFLSRQWTLYTSPPEAFEPNFNPKYKVELPPEIETNNRIFIIPGKTLRFGLYIVRFELVVKQEGRPISSQGHGWFRIRVSPIIPVLLGGSERTVNSLETLEIDASESQNPNGDNITYTWFCESGIADDPAGICKGMETFLPYLGAVLKFPPGKFTPGVSYRFRVQLTGEYPEEATETAEQRISISDASGLKVTCSFNCQEKVHPQEKLVLSAQCTNCADATFLWEVTNLSPKDYKKKAANHEQHEMHGMTTNFPTTSVVKATTKKHKPHKHLALQDSPLVSNYNSRKYMRGNGPIVLEQSFYSSLPTPREPLHEANNEYILSTRKSRVKRLSDEIPDDGEDSTTEVHTTEKQPPPVPNHSTAPSPIREWLHCSKFGNEGETLFLEPGCLEDGAEYNVRVFVRASDSKLYSMSEYRFKVNSPPRIGACQIFPPAGQALRTRFSIHCQGFEDEDEPLTYEFFYNNNYDLRTNVRSNLIGTHLGVLLKKRTLPDSKHLYIPVGNPINNYIGIITVVVSDYYGLSSEVSSNVTVRPPHAADKKELEKLVSSKDAGSIKDFLNVAGDFESALNLATSVGQILNSNLIPDLNYKDKAKFRRLIVEQVHTIPVKEVKLPKEILEPVEMVLRGDASEIEPEVCNKALDILQSVTENFSQLIEELSMSTNETYETANVAFSIASSLMRLTVGSEPYITVAHPENITTYIPERTLKKCNVSRSIFQVVDQLSSGVLTKRTRDEQDLSMESDYLSIYLRRADTAHKTDSLLGNKEKDAVRIPPVAAMYVNDTENHQLNIKMVSSPVNPYFCSESGNAVNAHTISLTIGETSKKGTEEEGVNIENAPNLVEVFLKRRGLPESMSSNISTEGFPNFEQHSVRFHIVNVPVANITSHIYIEMDNPDYTLLLTWTYGCIPTIVDFQQTPFVVSSHNQSHFLTFAKSDNMTPEIGEYVIGILPYVKAIANQLRREDDHLAFDHDEEAEVMNYNLTFFVSRCVYYDPERDIWSEEGCKVGDETTVDVIHCICSHMSVFSASFLVAPNTVDVTQTLELFPTAKDNMVVIGFMIAIWLLYFILLCYVVRKDKQDNGKKTTVVLQDNRRIEKYPYIVQMFTGIRPDAGTSASVSIQLHGRRKSSRVRKLVSKKRPVFETGGEDWFLFKTERNLGPLKAITVAHDNAGDRPDWYLSQVQVLDPYSGQFWFFLVGKWLSANPHKGLLSRYVQAVPRKDLKKFRIVFRQRALREFRERHAWFSVFQCSPRSSFTRAQRLTCAFALLVLAMLVNIMFFDIAPEESSEDYHEKVLKVGGFTINYIAMIIGLEGSLIAYPFGFIVVQMFSLIKPRHSDEDEVGKILAEAKWEVISESEYSIASSDFSGVSRDTEKTLSETELHALYPETVSIDTNTEFIRNFFSCDDKPTSPSGSGFLDTGAAAGSASTLVKALFDPSDKFHPWPLKVSVIPPPEGGFGDMHDSDAHADAKHEEEAKEFRLPWWFVYIAWTITIAVSLLNTFFIMLYGLTYGYEKSVDWVESNLLSFAASNVILDPVQVLIVLLISTHFRDAFRARQQLAIEE